MPHITERGRTRRRFRTVESLPVRLPQPTSKQLTRSRLSIVLTFFAWLGYVIGSILRDFVNHGAQGMRFTSEAFSYLAIITVLTYSALVYLACRQSALRRREWHLPVDRSELDTVGRPGAPTLTVLIPSYREEAGVIRQTLLSAALQEYPELRVVLLVDDPPTPTDEHNQQILAAALAQPAEIMDLLSVPAAAARQSLAAFEARIQKRPKPAASELRRLSKDFEAAAAWLERLAQREDSDDHVDQFVADHVIRRLANDLQSTSTALLASIGMSTPISVDRLRALYRRLISIFTVQVTSFERKRFASLSHEPNKAMNLNSYIGLMGRRFTTETTRGSLTLVEVAGDDADLSIPNPDYVLTLDADSVLLPEYCLRLVHFLEQPANERVAVAQTPYCAFPGATSRVERIAGATTDLQHIVHQGMSGFGAAYWVGANAVLRKKALDEIMVTEFEAGREIRRYIKDNTVIEDTESSIDLISKQWSLYNYPERLSFSATPPDFGSLCIQRQRWANGGLLILPKLVRLMFTRRRRREPLHLAEMFVRINYLASISWATLGLLVLLVYPYNDHLLSPLVFLSALPYFALMASDLRSFGYRRRDILSLYGFNLVLLPVNLAGVFSSIRQALNGQKTPFARTPKVKNRTTAPLSFVIAAYAIVGFSAASLARDIIQHNIGHAIFAGLNAALCAWGIFAFIGIRASFVDVWMNVKERLYKPERVQPRILDADLKIDPCAILDVGPHVLGEYVPSQVAADGAAIARPSSNPTRAVRVVS